LGAQTPDSCFEIESILVDACAFASSCNSASDPACQCEGKNEMFRMVIGPDDLNTDDMVCDWPNGGNNWWGVCQNAGTAATVAELNASIENCGWLEEPVNNILPAGSTVLMVTSTDMCVASNSFAGLSDTLIIIFQCSGNYTGHFANYNNGGNNLRTLEVDFGQDCEDIVTYNRSLLVDQNGLNVAADGARVDFTWDGDPTYVNEGCNAPVEQSPFSAGSDEVLCPGQNIMLNAQVGEGYTDLEWSGGAGTFSDENSANTTYIPAANEAQEITLTLSAQGCNGLITDEVTVLNLTQALIGIDAGGVSSICEGQSVTLSAQGSGLFSWSTNVVAPSITVDEPGTYSVSVTNSCGTFTESIELGLIAPPSVNVLNPIAEEICEGEMILLEAIGTGGLIMWSTLEQANAILTSAAGWYIATIQNECAIAQDSTEVIVIPYPEVEILPAGPLSICEGADLELTASGIGDVLWNTNETTPAITIDGPGTYSVVASTSCGDASAQVQVDFGGFLPVAEIEANDLELCPGESTLLSASGGDNYLWNGVASEADLTVDSPGSYTLTAINSCGENETTIMVLQDEVPLANLIDGPAFAICNGEDARVEVVGTGSFQWSTGEIANAIRIDSPGSYYVLAEASCGTDTAFFQVVVQDITAIASANPVLGDAPLTVTFDNETFNSQYQEWIFQQGAVSLSQTAIHTFQDKGEYEVVLIARTELGCEDRTTVLISVGACPFTLFMPNAFTPDGDDVNDQIKVLGNCIERFEWHIYDRWGREVFFTEDPGSRWSGADISGYAVADGEYPYWVQVLDSNGVTHRFTGSISVFR
ncbi:MAG: gliding motility-associated C-terminal domain-containing protein, partial [Bacteroidetes bacterium]|nr:gliding motility-associated C-terminal domain-containing protein [Bacteroidota bacterium]